MELAEEIRALEARTIAALEDVYAYHSDTKIVWRLLQQIVKEGRKFTVRNLETGTSIDQNVLLGRAQRYVTEHLGSATFQHFVAIFEDFFFEFLRHWLEAFPYSLSSKTVDLRAILSVTDTRSIVRGVIDKELNQLKYERLSDWFAYLATLVGLGAPSKDEIARLAEIKATRDILVHARGIANEIYASKAGSLARFPVGERLELPAAYHRESWTLTVKVVRDISHAAIIKSRSK